MSSQKGNSGKSGAPTYHNYYKFKPDRAVKLSQTEIQQKKHLLRNIDYNCCKRCSEKIKWKFQFGKYQALSGKGKCQECKKSTVRLAYRTLCDPCADIRKVCPGCCEFETDQDRDEAKMLRLMLKAGIDPNEVSAAELTAKQPEEFRTTTISDRQAEVEDGEEGAAESSGGVADDTEATTQEGEDITDLLDELADDDEDEE